MAGGADDRFRAAVAVNGVANQISAAANCDQGALWTPRLGWGRPPADFERLWHQSPLAHAERITTPLLMLQGEADLRCPAADNEQLFVALRALDRDRRVRALSGGVAPDAGDRPPRSPHRHARAHGALVPRARRARSDIADQHPQPCASRTRSGGAPGCLTYQRMEDVDVDVESLTYPG